MILVGDARLKVIAQNETEERAKEAPRLKKNLQRKKQEDKEGVSKPKAERIAKKALLGFGNLLRHSEPSECSSHWQVRSHDTHLRPACPQTKASLFHALTEIEIILCDPIILATVDIEAALIDPYFPSTLEEYLESHTRSDPLLKDGLKVCQ